MRGTFIAAVVALLLPLGEIAGAPPVVAAGEEGLEALDRFSETVRLVGEERILGMVGFFGQPQPVQWLVLTGLPDLKGTFRESIIACGKVLAERRFSALPGQDLPSRALDREAVKVTSAAAFQRAKILAENRRIAFDSAHFQLRVREEGNEPVWMLQLLSASRTPVGTVYLSARTGEVLRESWIASPERDAESKVSVR